MLPGVDATFAATNHTSASGMTGDISAPARRIRTHLNIDIYYLLSEKLSLQILWENIGSVSVEKLLYNNNKKKPNY